MAFPTTSNLDTFTGVDGTTPPNANWTNNTDNIGGTVGFQIQSNQAAGLGAANNHTAWWNASSFGADCEVFATMPTLAAGYMGVTARINTPGTAGIDCYGFYAIGGTSAEFYRLDNGVYTLLGAAISQTWTAGDRIGLEIVGSTLTGYRFNSGSWSVVGTRSDSTITAGGFIGLYADGATARFDDFGGGTVVTGSASNNTFRALLGVGR
jgi:hypothetical protein